MLCACITIPHLIFRMFKQVASSFELAVEVLVELVSRHEVLSYANVGFLVNIGNHAF